MLRGTNREKAWYHFYHRCLEPYQSLRAIWQINMGTIVGLRGITIALNMVSVDVITKIIWTTCAVVQK